MALSNLIPDPSQVAFTTLDWVALVVFLLATVVYHTFYALWSQRQPLETVKGKVALYRRTWVKRILDRDEQMLAVQSIRNLLMTSSFMASSALLVIAVVLNFLLGQGTDASAGSSTMSVKLLLLTGVYGYGFFSFLLSVRYLNHFTILVGADRDLIGSVEPVDAVTFLSNILNRAGNRFTMGQRAYYFSLPLLGWLVDAWVFLALTLGVLGYLVLLLDFKKWKPPLALRPASPENRVQGESSGAARAPAPGEPRPAVDAGEPGTRRSP